MEIKVNKRMKRSEELIFEMFMADRIDRNGLRSKNIGQDYFDCCYSGNYNEEVYTYGLNW